MVYNNQSILFDGYMLKNKQRTSTKRLSSEKLFKRGSSSSSLSIPFPPQETFGESVLKSREKNTNQIQNFNSKQAINQIY